MNQPQFKVDSRLAVLLSENYRSSESAIKELIDNSWDADADSISITLPDLNTLDPIVIKDDGSGMTPKELQSEYLVVAKNRISTKGKFTIGKKRRVKGRKGIGKFAGLVCASEMKLETWARGTYTSITLNKDNLLDASLDLEDIDLTPIIKECDTKLKGCCITLTGLNQNFKFPSAQKLQELLIRDYGREDDFSIKINDTLLSHEHIQGETKVLEENIKDTGKVHLAFTVAEAKKPFKQAGISLRVQGKVIGPPSFFGLDKSDDFPKKILGKIYGEIEADGLAQDITADWGAVIENSKGYEYVSQWVSEKIKEAAKAVYGQEIQLANARLQKRIKQRLSDLPEYKRIFAEQSLRKVLVKYYDEPDDKIDPIVNVIFESIENDDYFLIIDKIDKAKHDDIEEFASALQESSFAELSIMRQQIKYRLRLFDELDEMTNNPKTLEKHMHQALEKRLWILGQEFSMVASNITLKKISEQYLDSTFTGDRAANRPDLLLTNNLLDNHTIIEFKRPSHTIKHEDYLQAISYRNDLLGKLQNIDVILVGGNRDKGILTTYIEGNLKIMTYSEVISTARSQYNWLIKQIFESSLPSS